MQLKLFKNLVENIALRKAVKIRNEKMKVTKFIKTIKYHHKSCSYCFIGTMSYTFKQKKICIFCIILEIFKVLIKLFKPVTVIVFF